MLVAVYFKKLATRCNTLCTEQAVCPEHKGSCYEPSHCRLMPILCTRSPSMKALFEHVSMLSLVVRWRLQCRAECTLMWGYLEHSSDES